MPERLLTVNQLTLGFQQDNRIQKVIDNLSFELYRGETLGIVGESGSGKSLTALSIMGLLPETAHKLSGQLLFAPAKADLGELPSMALSQIRGKQIGMIFQEPMTALNPVLRCGEQVQEALMLHKKLDRRTAREHTMQLLQRLGLNDSVRIYLAYPHQLSGGQKQRVLLAMAMAGQPQLLIADEPTTALDVTMQRKIIALLHQLKEEEQLSLLFISHDLGVVASIADRILVMQNGRLVESGPTREVFANPQHPYTRGLIACKPQWGHRYHRLPVLADFTTAAEYQPPVTTDRVPAQPPHEPASPFLRVEELTVDYHVQSKWWSNTSKGHRAVANVSFSIYPGETLGLVGESGCGKSTIAKTLARLLQPTSGRITIEGTSYADLLANRDFYRQVQIIFQDPFSSLNPRLPIGAAIAEPMLVHRIESSAANRKAKVVDLLETVGLQADDFQKYPHQFSGGQRQRISIARALSVDPRFIICDEVVSALDVSVQAVILNLLKDLQEQKGLTYLFISHDLAVVQFISQRIAVMQAGKIVELASADQIYRQPAHPYTRQLIDAIPRLNRKK